MILFTGCLAILIYGVFVLILLYQWNQIAEPQLNDITDVSITVLIPVRNEAEHIQRLIQSVYQNSTETEALEVIVVNDHSLDQTEMIVQDLRKKYTNLKFKNLTEGQQGKKAAITHGVSLACGELIICTDGDSEVSENWLALHKQAYLNGSKLSFGPVKLFNQRESRWIDILNLELSALVAVGAATLQLGKPTMINGCNYSFSKEAFEEVGGYEGNQHIASGDDEFLLRKVFKEYPNQITFLKNKGAVVKSEAPQNLSEFYFQRKRWASKWKFHKDVFSSITPVFLFLVYGVLIVTLTELFSINNILGWIIIVLKLFIDFVFICASMKIHDERVSFVNFLLLQIIYPFYVVFFGVASNFGKYSWRERSHKI